MEKMVVSTERLRKEIEASEGRKCLLFGASCFPQAAALRDKMEYLACSDKSDAALDTIRESAAEMDIHLIPASELGEDCYFGRFNLIFCLSSFQGLPRLVDEIMALRRLLIKGGSMVIADRDEDGLYDDCLKQLKRCGFTDPFSEKYEIDGEPFFLIRVTK